MGQKERWLFTGIAFSNTAILGRLTKARSIEDIKAIAAEFHIQFDDRDVIAIIESFNLELNRFPQVFQAIQKAKGRYRYSLMATGDANGD